MAFSSISDARTKLGSTTTDVDSQILYANNNLLDSTTIFYTNEAKTILASAGNYVIPTQFKSYYVTLGSDGKIVGSKTELVNAGMDVSFVDGSIMNFSADSGEQKTNDLDITYSLNPSTNLLTDTTWDSSRRWLIENGTINSTPLTNINLSDMKGYDLVIRNGVWGNLWGGTEIYGFLHTYLLSSTIHIAADPNRKLIGTLPGGGDDPRVNYFFRPDYLIPKQAEEYPTFFRRMPDALPIFDRNGVKKEFAMLINPLLDCVVKDSGTFTNGGAGAVTRTFRNPKRQNKGLTKRKPTFFVNFVNGQVSGVNSNFYTSIEGGIATANIYENVPIADRLYHHADTFIRVGTAWVKSGGTTSNPNYITDSLIDQSWCCAVLESLLVAEADRDTWTFNNGTINKTYTEVNPYEWTTAINSGIGYFELSPANQYLGLFRPLNADVNNPNNLTHAAIIEHDGEAFIGAGRKRLNTGLAIDGLFASCKAYSIANNWAADGAVIPKFSIYQEGIYKTLYFGTGTSGWLYVDPSVSIATVKTTDLYSDYHNYYINGTISRTTMASYNAFYEGAKNGWGLFFCSSYLNTIVTKWYFYALVHDFDISKKILSQIYSVDDAKQRRVSAYSWRYMEPLPYFSDFNWERKGFEYGTYIADNPSQCASHFQSLAVWGFAYCDGLSMWDDPNPMGGEYNHGPCDNINFANFYYGFGNLQQLDNGVFDWLYVGYWQVEQNRDIVAADTNWEKTQLLVSGTWTSNTDANNSNYPVMLYNQQKPISAYKLSADGTEALLIIVNPFNNGYTKATHTVRLPTKSNQQFDVDTWGNFTTVIRLKGL
jgi:hypothetical protein